MLKKYNDHVLNEKKEIKTEKSDIEKKIMKLFKDKPLISSTSTNWPDAKCVYSLSDIKKYINGDNLKIDNIFQDMIKKNKKIKSIKIKNLEYKDNYSYYYYEDYVSDEEAEECKIKMEESQKTAKKIEKDVEKAKNDIEKNINLTNKKDKKIEDTSEKEKDKKTEDTSDKEKEIDDDSNKDHNVKVKVKIKTSE